MNILDSVISCSFSHLISSNPFAACVRVCVCKRSVRVYVRGHECVCQYVSLWRKKE